MPTLEFSPECSHIKKPKHVILVDIIAWEISISGLDYILSVVSSTLLGSDGRHPVS